jgi:hypothetical protein
MLERLRDLTKQTENKPPTPQQMADKLSELDLKGKQNEFSAKKAFYELRNLWGFLLALLLAASVAFQFWLAYQIGTGQLRFEGYETFLNIIAGESFVQVVGLCIVVVRCLFPEGTLKK